MNQVVSQAAPQAAPHAAPQAATLSRPARRSILPASQAMEGQVRDAVQHTAGDATARRRGWCPGVRHPMATGDGLLARLHPPGGRLTLAQAEAVAAAAATCGNGEIDATARGNLQLRGIRDAAAADLAARMDRIGLLEPAKPGPHRLTVTSPLAGLDPAERFDAAATADAIEEIGREVADLPAKIAVAIDGGGAFPLDGVEADIRFVAGEDGLVAVALAGDAGAVWIGAVEFAAVPHVAAVLLQTFAAFAREAGRAIRRVRDLSPERRTCMAAVAGLRPATPPGIRLPIPRAGRLDMTDNRAALLAGLPFGRCTAPQLAALAALAGQAGAGDLRVSFTRGILVAGCHLSALPALIDSVARLGLIVDGRDPRLAVSACPGRPACASGGAPAAADAARLAPAARALLATGTTLHVSGCPKGCAHPRAADLTLVGQPDGRYGLVRGGTAQDPIELRLSIDEVAARLASGGLRGLADASGQRP